MSDTCWDRASVLSGESDKGVWLGSMVVPLLLLVWFGSFFLNYYDAIRGHGFVTFASPILFITLIN